MPAKKTSKPTADTKAKSPAASKAAKPVEAEPIDTKSADAKPADAKSVDAKPEAAPKPVAKGKPQIPGKPEPSWAKFNQGGHAQKMSKGRPFRHQGR